MSSNNFFGDDGINKISDMMENGGLDELFKNDSVSSMMTSMFGDSMNAATMKKMMSASMDALKNMDFDPSNALSANQNEKSKEAMKNLGNTIKDTLGDDTANSMLNHVKDNFTPETMTDMFKNFPTSFHDTSNIQRYMTKIFKKDENRDEYFTMSSKSKPDRCGEHCLICHDEFEKDESCCNCDNGHTLHKECYFEFLEVNNVTGQYECLYCKDNMSKDLFKFI